MQGNILLGYWEKNQLNGQIFYFKPELNQWFKFEFLSGKCVKFIKIEEEKKVNNKFLENYREYKNLLEEGLIDYFKNIESSQKSESDSLALLLEKEHLFYFIL